MEDLFLSETSNLDKLLDELEEQEAPAVKSPKTQPPKQQHSSKPLPFDNKQNSCLNADNAVQSVNHSASTKHSIKEVESKRELSEKCLIDFSIPEIASVNKPTLPVSSNTIADLDFLLPVLQTSHDNLQDDVKAVSTASHADVDNVLTKAEAAGDAATVKSEVRDLSLCSNLLNDRREKRDAEVDLPKKLPTELLNSVIMSDTLDVNASLQPPPTDTTNQDASSITFFPQQSPADTNISPATVFSDSVCVGFNDVAIDESEFAKFMEESTATKVGKSLNFKKETSQTNNLKEEPSLSNQMQNSNNSTIDQLHLISSQSAPNDEQFFGLSVNSNETNTSVFPEEGITLHNSSTNSQLRLKKMFHKDLKTLDICATDQNREFTDLVDQLEIPVDIPTNISCDDRVSNSETLLDLSPISETTNNVENTNEQSFTTASNVSSVTELLVNIASSPDPGVNVDDFSIVEDASPETLQSSEPSNASPSPSQLTGENQSTLPTINQEQQLQRIPSVSPPSYSSVIAGEYNAGTMIQENPSPSAVSGRIQQSTDSSVEQAVEATEDNTQDNATYAERPNSLDARQLIPNVAYHSVAQRPGDVKPRWMPDEERSVCSKCNAKFTFTRRRHHCRACGQIFCSSCCSEKSKLAYLKHAEARVCIDCFTKIIQADAFARLHSASNPDALPIAAAAPPTASVPISVLRNDSATSGASVTPKSVRFSDGTKPDHPDVLPATPPPPPVRAPRANRLSKRTSTGVRSSLPPIIIECSEDGACTVDEDPDVEYVMNFLRTNGKRMINFALSANLYVMVKIVQYCSTSFYYFLSSGLDSVGHSEVAVLLEIDDNDNSLPMQVFNLYTHLFNAARKGKAIQANDFLPIEDFATQSENVFGSSNDYAGLIFVRRTMQDIQSLSLEHTADEHSFLSCPTVQFSSTLFALLVCKSEVSWAKLFYARLLLGLGAQFKQYPYPLVNFHNRTPVCFEVANTILGILCDFRNYKYKVVTVPGLSVFITKGSVIVNIPCNRFVDVAKIMNSSNEHVVALGSDTFLTEADCQSHLVCLQEESTRSYHSQVLTATRFQNEDDGCVGAAFVVFNGSLKSGSTQQARCSIVEALDNPDLVKERRKCQRIFLSETDGVMIQLLPEKMAVLKESLRAVEDFRISCTQSLPVKREPETSEQNASGSSISGLQENVNQFMEVRWVSEDTKFNIGLSSPIDFQSLEGVVGYNVQGKSEKKGKQHVLRWNQVFFFKSTSDILDMSRLAERVANGCFQSLAPHVKLLRDSRQTKIGVRVNIHPDDVGYAVGSRGLPLPDVCLNALDDGLIPLTHEASSSLHAEDDPVVFELIFSVLDMRPSWKVVSK